MELGVGVVQGVNSHGILAAWAEEMEDRGMGTTGF
jgi:hypothetical protein